MNGSTPGLHIRLTLEDRAALKRIAASLAGTPLPPKTIADSVRAAIKIADSAAARQLLFQSSVSRPSAEVFEQ